MPSYTVRIEQNERTSADLTTFEHDDTTLSEKIQGYIHVLDYAANLKIGKHTHTWELSAKSKRLRRYFQVNTPSFPTHLSGPGP